MILWRHADSFRTSFCSDSVSFFVQTADESDCISADESEEKLYGEVLQEYENSCLVIIEKGKVSTEGNVFRDPI